MVGDFPDENVIFEDIVDVVFFEHVARADRERRTVVTETQRRDACRIPEKWKTSTSTKSEKSRDKFRNIA